MELKDLMDAVQAIAEKKDATAEDVQAVKSQLESFATKEAVSNMESKAADVLAQVDELKEQIADMEAKGNYSMDLQAQAKTFDLNAEVKSLIAENPQVNILEKGLTSADQASAGITIRTQYEAEVIKPMRERSAFLSRISHKPVLNEEYKRLVKIKDAEMRWGGENVANGSIANTGVQGYAEVTGTYGKAEAYPFVTSEMLHDSSINVMGDLAESVLDEIAVGINAAALNGDGNKKPKGMLRHIDGAAHEKFEVQEIGAAGALPKTTPALLKALRGIARSLKTGYRPGAVWMMNEAMRDELAGYVYTDGKSIINEDVTEMPDGRLLSKEIVVDCEMPDGVITYGDLAKGFTFLTVQGMTVMPNPYVAPGNVQVYHSLRVGTIVNDVQALKIIKLKA
ncbi:phage major capsid protein [Vibrio fortis]|uniref:phage major capsid protein n=1 Tax=Vibrio fortis TaxID=212667 RepID=UPI0038CD609C